MDEKWLVRAFVAMVILLAVGTIVIGSGRLADVVAGLLVVPFAVSWVIAWRTRRETIRFLPRLIGVALLLAAGLFILFALGDTPPATIAAEPAGFIPNGTGRIAFVERWAIYVVNADGTGKTRLTTEKYGGTFPAWSPDGQQLAFQARDEIYVMNADGTNPTRLTNSLAADNSCPRWSPDGRRIAFLSNRSGTWDVYVMNADGADQARLTYNYQARWCTPAWSPDGQHLAFVSRPSTMSYAMHIVNADGTDPIHLARDTRYELKHTWRAAWSPDGKQIAFIAPDGFHVMDADGTRRTRLTDLRSSFTSCDDPVWSPDGQHIAFVSTAEGHNIYVMDADGTDPTRITAYEAPPPGTPYANITSLIWSPDGSRLAYDGGPLIGLYVVDMDGANRVHLGGGSWPTWAP
jgi:Tol biopolymer transport system component